MNEFTEYEVLRFMPIKLPYHYKGLEPYIDEETMQIHYNKHYIGYLNKLNRAVEKYDIADDIMDMMRNVDKYPLEIRDNGGGYVNHSMFWKVLKPNPNKRSNIPTGVVLNKIKDVYGTFGQFKETIIEAAQRCFGSGWLWWVMNRDGSTNILVTPYQDNPYMPEYNAYPILGIDLWEHAYYLKYDAEKTKYVKNIFKIINWDEVKKRCIRGNQSIFDINVIN